MHCFKNTGEKVVLLRNEFNDGLKKPMHMQKGGHHLKVYSLTTNKYGTFLGIV